jgi:ribose 5-phosphate isomerase B
MKVAIGADHAGLRLKEHLKSCLVAWGHEVIDLGTSSTEPSDYPDYGAAVGRAVVDGKAERGLCVCGSGPLTARMSREHNDANVICFGERFIGTALAEAALEVFLGTPFAGGRHAARVGKLNALEK